MDVRGQVEIRQAVTASNVQVDISVKPRSIIISSTDQSQSQKSCTAGMGLELGDPASIGNCWCNDCKSDRSAVERALRKNRLERELHKLNQKQEAKSAIQDAKTICETHIVAGPSSNIRRRACKLF